MCVRACLLCCVCVRACCVFRNKISLKYKISHNCELLCATIACSMHASNIKQTEHARFENSADSLCKKRLQSKFKVITIYCESYFLSDVTCMTIRLTFGDTFGWVYDNVAQPGQGWGDFRPRVPANHVIPLAERKKCIG